MLDKSRSIFFLFFVFARQQSRGTVLYIFRFMSVTVTNNQAIATNKMASTHKTHAINGGLLHYTLELVFSLSSIIFILENEKTWCHVLKRNFSRPCPPPRLKSTYAFNTITCVIKKHKPIPFRSSKSFRDF